MATTTETRTERWVMTCRRCKHVVTREVQIIVTSRLGSYYQNRYWPSQAVTRVAGTTFAYPRVVCPRCGDYQRDGDRVMMTAKRITGREAPEIRCDSRCTGAKGSECVCACGGANHGADHAG